MKRKILPFLAVCLFSTPVWALELRGHFEQGGFVIGKTVPGSEVSLGDYLATSGKNGDFVLPVARMAPEKATLKIMLMEGIEETHPLTIRQREYETQSLKVDKKFVSPGPEALKRIKEDKAEILKARSVFDELAYITNTFKKPVKDIKMSSFYGSRRLFNGEERSWHKGVDFAAPTGTPVYAPQGATVRLALKDSFFNGNLLILDHGYNMMTIYAHLNSMAVKAGDKVAQGQKIGTIGATGRATGPHLHWGLYWRNIALDPMFLLKEPSSN